MLWDALVIVLYFAAILTIGLKKGGGEKSLEGYALGNRSIPWWAILASILASEISAATFLGAPGEGFALRNFTYLQLGIGTILGRLVVGALFIGPYYRHGVVSIYEFLGIRFGPLSRRAASLVFLVTRALASGTRLYVAAILLVLAIEIAGGTTPTSAGEIAIFTGSVVVLVALTALYTAFGGIKAVIWTDLIQAGILVASLAVTLGILFTRIPGGWHGAHALLTAPDDLRVFDSGLLPGAKFFANVKSVLGQEYTLFAAFIASTFITLATHGTDQDMVQRMLTAKNPRSGKLAVILSGLADLPIAGAFVLIGILLWAFYQTHPDPRLPKENPQVFAWFILTQLPAGFRGLLVAGLLATAMGSLSTALNALATSFCRDFYLPGWGQKLGEAGRLRAIRWATVGFAAVLTVIGVATARVVVADPHARILPIVLGVFGYTYGSLLGLFLIGLFTERRGSDAGNVTAMIAGFLVVAVLSGLPSDLAVLCGHAPLAQPEWLPAIAFPWRVSFGAVTTVAVGVLFRTPPADA
jgi:SSS family solute:Na+ symporter